MSHWYYLLTLLFMGLAVSAIVAGGAQKPLPNEPGVYAVIETSMGTFVAKLYDREAPVTVQNFVGLATGKKPWRDPRNGQMVNNRPFYDGLAFHRVIPGFMIQGGCPLGTGTGGPGFSIPDEFSPQLRHSGPGILSMANAGPNTGGSQFFVTVAATPWLDNRHSVFGKVVKGMEVVTAISQAQRDQRDRPLTPVVMKKVTIETVR